MQDSWKLESLTRAAAYFTAPQPDLLKGLDAACRIQNMLCDLLEQIADSIPGAVDRGLCETLAAELGPLMRSIHQFEEQTLFPFAAGVQQAAETVARLRHEHIEDECFAEEVTDALHDLSHREHPENPEAIGYMLRGFFESMRRHVAFESEHFRPLLLKAPTTWIN